MRTCLGGFCNRGRGALEQKTCRSNTSDLLVGLKVAMWGFPKTKGYRVWGFGVPVFGETTMWLALLPVGFLAVAGFVGPYY